ncbi:tyrosine-type recombinase/integrase [Rhizobium leucaenae]|uniref:Integrase n=1 Tax=Rhizobium leucaenae TaxID=29450 RepID=A0A7W7A0T8_9HYPH|nr:tyrosine-type recombinase/integrase [Rhizobium leucaenae]MBB4571693.1 integrase [Rhizobium leucaenae]
MTREILTSTLATLSAELRDLKKEAALLSPKLSALSAVQRSEWYDRHPEKHTELEAIPTGPIPHRYHHSHEHRKQLVALQERLGRIGQALALDKTAWEAERTTFETVVGILGRVENKIATPAALRASAPPEPVQESEADERAFKPTTLLSVAGRSILDARKVAVNPNDKDASRYEERLETAFAAFLDVVGDKPLSYYLPIHMQDFATVLARLPPNRSKYAIFSGLTLREIGEKNARLPPDQRKKCLSESTVASYLSEVKNIWSRVAAGVPGLRDMGAYRVTMPQDAEDSIDREPLAVKSVNVWLRDAKTSKRLKKPHQSWLPFVGLLTGMRLAELVYLQKTDIIDVEGNEVIDLRKPLLINGREIDRPAKTKTSKRIVAIHPLLHDSGFIEYAKNVQSRDGFVFGRFQKANDPPDAAQKQMSNWMEALGIHETQRQVFHSLRHSAKDWLRDNVGERLADKQCGHALNGVSANYGAKALKASEVRKIMAMPAPEDVDFSPFMLAKGHGAL